MCKSSATEEATAYSDDRGYCVIPYVAEQGENEIKLTFVKEGYHSEIRPRIALPTTWKAILPTVTKYK